MHQNFAVLQAFSKNGQRTMELKDWRLDFLVNSADGIMFYDKAKLNYYYKCTGKQLF